MNQQTGNSRPDSITREIRFAVVMYGGVSLAVYMNGIAQELLNMVRSTSPSAPEKPDGTCGVYRDVARYLTEKDHEAFGHTFVVDIISGTSAGGINGVCLAKSLVRGIESLQALEHTWLAKGDIDTLLNDQRSDQTRYPSAEPKTSLLNSQRMYGLLLEAFTAMEKEAQGEGTDAPGRNHVKSMDLFVTTTDIMGLQLPILIGNGHAEERIHKHVFPFVFRERGCCGEQELNHFERSFDPMLAFASRCTSSFPAAFEPVTIASVRNWLDQQASPDSSWKQDAWAPLFFSPYLDINDGIPLEERPFADGGYLDNRPFGHAIRAIHARQADCPIMRKLLFIDPKPEMPDKKRKPKEISFVRNLGAAMTLPQYETIREELDSIAKRNDWIGTVNSIMENLQPTNRQTFREAVARDFASQEEQAELFASPGRAPSGRTGKQNEEANSFWLRVSREGLRRNPEPELRETQPTTRPQGNGPEDFDTMSGLFGNTYPPYHYTRREDTSAQLGNMLIGAMNVRTMRKIAGTVPQIVALWRTMTFDSPPPSPESLQQERTDTNFFRYFDLDFRIRRLNFFRKRIETAIQEQSATPLIFGLSTEDAAGPAWNEAIETGLRRLYLKLVEGLRALYSLRSLLLSGPTRNPLAEKAKTFGSRLQHLLATAHRPAIVSGIDGVPLITCGFGELAKLFDADREENEATPFATLFPAMMEEIKSILEQGWHATKGCVAVRDLVCGAFAEFGECCPELAGRMRATYDLGYELYDCSRLPLMSGGEYGEGTQVDVFRISPFDAQSLWNSHDGDELHPKLAGVAFGSFGGFLDRQWRRNDVMWGRLDAAEQLISTLVPDTRKRSEFVLKAQYAILTETIAPWIAELKSGPLELAEERRQLHRLEEIQKSLEAARQQNPEQPECDPEWKRQFMRSYDVERQLDSARNLRRAGRSSAILSSMLRRLDGGNGMQGRLAAYIKAFGRILLGMLDFSTPKTLTAIIGTYWLHLVTLTGIILVAGSIFIGRVSELSATATDIRGFGITLLCISGMVWLARQGFERWILGRSGSGGKRLLLRVAGGVLLFLLALLLLFASETLMVYGGQMASLFWNGFTGIIHRQTGWLPLR